MRIIAVRAGMWRTELVNTDGDIVRGAHIKLF
jgi:hypothetical protein